GVLQVAVAGPRTEVDPAADVAVPQEAMMLFVGKWFDDRGFDLAADFGVVPQRDAVFDRRMFVDAGVGADVNGSAQEAKRADRGVVIDNNWAIFSIGHQMLAKGHILGDKQAVANFAVARFDPVFKILAAARQMVLQYIVGIFEQRQP